MFTDSDALEKVILAALPQYKTSLIGVTINHEKSNVDKPQNIATLVFSIEKQDEVKSNVLEFLQRLGASFDEINFIFSAKAKLTKPVILRAVKIFQPINIDDIEAHLKDRGFFYTIKDLHNDLDELRKAGYLVWKEGFYSVTEAALSIIPHGNSKFSSDVVRALEFKKKKW